MGTTAVERDFGVRRSRVYRDGVLVCSDIDPGDISDHLTDPRCLVWLDLCEPTAADLALIADEFGLNPLAVEDASTERQRPKLDRYPDHVFLTLYGLRIDTETLALSSSEIAVFASSQYLITVRKDGHFDMDQVVAAWDSGPDLAGEGIGYLLWGLLDHVVDGHFDVVQDLDDAVAGLEDLLFAERPNVREVQRRAYDLRKGLVGARRAALPMREVVNSLMRRDLHLVGDPMQPYYQDVYDHVLRVTEQTETLRDLVTTLLETNLTMQGNQLNEIMKKLTSWAAIIAVPTAVTGFYGQNVPYPGFQKSWGLVTSVSIIVVSMLGLYTAFRSRDWL